MDDAVHSKPRRRRWPALALFVVFILCTWWLTAATWIHTPSARGEHPVAVIVQWLLSPLLAGILAAWWYGGRRALGKGLLTCAGAGLLVSAVNFAFIAIWPATAYPEELAPASLTSTWTYRSSSVSPMRSSVRSPEEPISAWPGWSKAEAASNEP